MSRSAPRVLVFDSGMGGLSVARAIRSLIPEAALNYAADTAAFPYGAWDEDRLIARIGTVVERLIAAVDPQVVVVGCNTASTLALEHLRNRFDVPFVGTVPAIKPAAAETRSGIIGVLATPGTVSREYTKALVDTFAFHCEVVLHGCPGLAELAERKLAGRSVECAAVAREIAPVFVERDAGRTDVVVLGCTHYPLLAAEISEAAPWPCHLIDPSEAIARRVRDVLPEDATGRQGEEDIVYVTSRAGADGADAFACEGFRRCEVMQLPV